MDEQNGKIRIDDDETLNLIIKESEEYIKNRKNCLVMEEISNIAEYAKGSKEYHGVICEFAVKYAFSKLGIIYEPNHKIRQCEDGKSIMTPDGKEIRFEIKGRNCNGKHLPDLILHERQLRKPNNGYDEKKAIIFVMWSYNDILNKYDFITIYGVAVVGNILKDNIKYAQNMQDAKRRSKNKQITGDYLIPANDVIFSRFDLLSKSF